MKKTSPKAKIPRSPRARFPVVGIGASAGGLEAAAALLRAFPARPGIAFVLVQHLSPHHESFLHTLLARATKMPVQLAENGVRVERDHVYVIPPNKDMSIHRETLRLSARRSNDGRHMPVDRFFRSLAEDQQANAIGVILSGTASDGTRGLLGIKAAGGVAFAQDPKSARHSGMPESAIEAGAVDYVLPPEGIAEQLARITRLRRGQRTAPVEDSAAPPENTAGVNLIHVASFFREPGTFPALRNRVFPKLLGKSSEKPIRIWVPGCSTGEEAYSLAIALLEFLEAKDVNSRLILFGTDISLPAIQMARAGTYSKAAVANVSPERLRRFFTKVEDGYQINQSVRDFCVFARQDVGKDPPFSKLDLISCRNVLIDMVPALHKRIMSVFHYALNPGGFLLPGKSESLGPASSLFLIQDRKCNIYLRNSNVPSLPLELLTEARRELVQARIPKRLQSRAARDLMLIEKVRRQEAGVHREGERREIARLRQKFGATSEHLESTIESQEAANEEIRAAHEEVLSANEELQSTNEELETAKEELQASNEELATLNEELRNRNLELSQLMNNLSDLLVGVDIPIVTLGNDHRVRRFTPAAGNLLNLIATDIGRPISNIKPNIEIQGLDALITEVAGKGIPVEKDVQDQNGRWHSLRIRPYTRAENKTDGVLMALMDIDAMKRSFDRVQRSEHEAIADRDFSTALLDLSGALVMVRDPEGNVVGLNRAAQELSGYSLEEVKGKPTWNGLIPPEGADLAKSVFVSALGGITAKDYESVWIRKDGLRRTLVWSTVPDRDADGSVKRVVSIGLDITARKQAEEALRANEERLRHSNAELKRTNEDLNQFAYSASHDLQEPLRMVAIYSQMLQRKYQGKLDGNADQYLGFALQGAKRMELLVKSLLEYAQAVNVDGQAAAVDCGVVLQEALSNLAAAIEESRAVVTHEHLPTVTIQEVHLLQLFQNIVGNAIKYRSQAPPRIQIGAERHASEWKICIRDNGIGIAPKYADRIFGIFKRLHTGAEYEGSGIGLATCKRIVERYGGRIWVDSEEGKGATFCFTLPTGEQNHAIEAN